MIALSSEVYVASDSTKFGRDVTIAISPLEAIDYIITDKNLNQTFIKQFKKTRTNLIISEHP